MWLVINLGFLLLISAGPQVVLEGEMFVQYILLLTRPQVCDDKAFWREMERTRIVHAIIATPVNIMNMSIYFACQYLN